MITLYFSHLECIRQVVSAAVEHVEVEHNRIFLLPNRTQAPVSGDGVILRKWLIEIIYPPLKGVARTHVRNRIRHTAVHFTEGLAVGNGLVELILTIVVKEVYPPDVRFPNRIEGKILGDGALLVVGNARRICPSGKTESLCLLLLYHIAINIVLGGQLTKQLPIIDLFLEEGVGNPLLVVEGYRPRRLIPLRNQIMICGNPLIRRRLKIDRDTIF